MYHISTSSGTNVGGCGFVIIGFWNLTTTIHVKCYDERKYEIKQPDTQVRHCFKICFITKNCLD